MSANFNSEYETLGVVPGAEWVEIQLAYRRLRQRYHPDKASASGLKADVVMPRFMAIQHAYDALASHRRQYGRLPDEERGPSQAETPEQRPAFTGGSSARPLKPRRAAVVAAFAAMIALGPVALLLIPDAEFAAPGSGRDPQPTAFGRYADAYAAANPQLRAGMLPREVLDALGKPDTTDGNVWYYGDSYVRFSNGKVREWQRSADATFAATSESYVETIEQRAPFVTVGATIGQVEAIQGSPDYRGDLEWAYGPSKIYFRSDRVVGWYSSPMQPLRVAERVVAP